MQLLRPKEFKIKTEYDGEYTYLLSRIPYDPDGKEIGVLLVPTAVKTGDYKAHHALCRRMYNYIARVVDDKPIILSTSDLINNHVPDFNTGIKLEVAMMEYNYLFFVKGVVSSFSNGCAPMFQEWSTKILTGLQGLLSTLGQQLSTNSEQSTPSKTQ